MPGNDKLHGLFPAVVTPLDANGQIHFANLQHHIQCLKGEGCHGILLLGTTGEGPSLSVKERKAVLHAALDVSSPLSVVASTGCANLSESIELTQHAFSSGADAVLVMPPFYFRDATTAGLLAYYTALLHESVPDSGSMLLYHFPKMSVPVSFELLELLLQADNRVQGIKDSSGDKNHLAQVLRRFPTLKVFVGDERLLLDALQQGGAGCMTAALNILTPLAYAVWQAFLEGQPAQDAQARLSAGRVALDNFRPFPPAIKALLAARYRSSGWNVRPPLTALEAEASATLLDELRSSDLNGIIPWLEDAGVGSGKR